MGYGADFIREYFGDGSRFGVQIQYVLERQLLGTAGALRNADQYLRSTFLALNGDSYVEVDLAAMVDFHQRRRLEEPELLGTVVAVELADASAFGRLELDASGRLLRFQEKTSAVRVGSTPACMSSSRQSST